MTPTPVAVSARQRGPALRFKRGIDVMVACVLLALLAPLLGVVALAIRLESRGPVLFRQTRIGRAGLPFTMLKFRSMYANADPRVHEQFVRELLRNTSAEASATTNESDAPAYKLANDPRVTRVGAVIRRLSIDELPQLVNVVRGDMSLVGPRPDVPYSVEEYEPWQWRRFEVLPGLTGLWQVSGRGALSPTDMLQLDVEYADRWSLFLDVRILLATVPVVLRKIGSA